MPVKISDLSKAQQRIITGSIEIEEGEKEDKYRRKPKEERTWTDAILGEIVFDSQGEMHRWCQLRQLERAGEIQNLRRQVTFVLIDIVLTGIIKNVHYAIRYIADFQYEEKGETITEDFKGHLTDEYRRKKKLMYHLYGIKIKETHR